MGNVGVDCWPNEKEEEDGGLDGVGLLVDCWPNEKEEEDGGLDGVGLLAAER